MLRIAFGVGVASAALAGHAHAGAWMAPEEGQLISSVAYGWEGDYSESDTYFEHLLSERAAIVATPRVQQPTAERAADVDVAVGLKVAVFEAPNAAGAVQAAAVWRSEPGDYCGEAGGEIRAMGGIASGDVYYNLEVAARMQENGCASRRLDFTVGYKSHGGWMALAQAFVEDGEGDFSVKAQASLVMLGEDGGGMQIGLRVRVDGEDTQPALVLGWWGAAPRW